MSNPMMDAALAQVEDHLNHLSDALLCRDPESLTQACAALQCAAVEFSKLMGRTQDKKSPDEQLRSRLQQLAALMASRREILIRSAGMAERALAALVPATSQSATYGNAAGYARPAYGGVARQSGELRGLSA